MFYKRAIITIDVPIGKAFSYLKTRYDSDAYQESSKMCKGYIPLIELINSKENKFIEFKTKAREPVLGIFFGGWRWGYTLTVVNERSTKVEIWYKWNLWMAFLGSGTTGHQAANEITETASALDALSK